MPPAVLESVSYLTNRTLLQKRDLISLMPEHVVAYDIKNKNLATVDWQVPFGKGPVGISYRGADSLSPASAEFLNAFHAAAKRMKPI